MNIEITREDIEHAREFLNDFNLVQTMNDYGLTIGSMSIILNGIFSECDRIEQEMDSKNEKI